jgi:ribonuclease P/MRP protein subunit RPP40
LIYINDIDDGVDSKIVRFADGTKLYRRIAKEEDVTKLKEDLVLLRKWSTEWLMPFYVENVRFCTWVVKIKWYHIL